MKKQNNIEEIFKEAFENYEVDPGVNAWTSIQSGIQSGGAIASTAAKASISWVSTGIVSLTIVAISVGGYYFFDKKGEGKKNVIPAAEENISKSTPLILEEESTNLSTQKNKIDQVIEAPSDKKEKASRSIKSQPDYTKTEKSIIKSETDQSNLPPESPTKITVSSVKVVPPTSKENINEKEAIIPVDTDFEHSQNENGNVASNNALAKKNAIKPDEKDNKIELPVSDFTSTKTESVVEPSIHIPNFFSPNFDGTNDKFVLRSEEVDAMEIVIFGTSGVVYETKGESISWDGNLNNGNAAPEGTYFYQLVLVKGNKKFPKKGSVTLRRD